MYWYTVYNSKIAMYPNVQIIFSNENIALMFKE